jgi:hypothetical protein
VRRGSKYIIRVTLRAYFKPCRILSRESSTPNPFMVVNGGLDEQKLSSDELGSSFECNRHFC